jgi:hypothetical protein
VGDYSRVVDLLRTGGGTYCIVPNCYVLQCIRKVLLISHSSVSSRHNLSPLLFPHVFLPSNLFSPFVSLPLLFFLSAYPSSCLLFFSPSPGSDLMVREAWDRIGEQYAGTGLWTLHSRPFIYFFFCKRLVAQSSTSIYGI